MDSQRPVHGRGNPGAVQPAQASCRFCRHVNPPAARFCNECGSPLELQPCWACEAVNSAGAERCHACGASLASTNAPDLDRAELQLQGLLAAHREGSPTREVVDRERINVVFGRRPAHPLREELTHAGVMTAQLPACLPVQGIRRYSDGFLAPFSGAAPMRGPRLVRGRRAARPLLVMIALTVLAVPVMLTRWLVDPPAVRVERTGEKVRPVVGLPAVATSTPTSTATSGPTSTVIVEKKAVPPSITAAPPRMVGGPAKGAEQAVPTDGVPATASLTTASPTKKSARGGRSAAPVVAASPHAGAQAADHGRGHERAGQARQKPVSAASRSQTRSMSAGPGGRGGSAGPCGPSSVLAGCVPGA